MNQQYKYQLDKSSKKFICPQCGKKRLVRYINMETKEYLPETVGRCDGKAIVPITLLLNNISPRITFTTKMKVSSFLHLREWKPETLENHHIYPLIY
jgi:hypothetical protein